jgi:hypothetical protein
MAERCLLAVDRDFGMVLKMTKAPEFQGYHRDALIQNRST